MSPSLVLRRFWTLEAAAYSLRVFIALGGITLLCWWRGDMASLIPLFLGAIACALAETDDDWPGRLAALLVTLVCFALASLAMELLFVHPWLLVVSLGVAAFGMTMFGAVGQRYATIANATLILAIYTLISLEQRGSPVLDELWREPSLLVAGAAWYGVISVVWCALFSRQPLQLALARVYRELARYLGLKAALFEPLRELDVESRRLALAHQNGVVVEALNDAKERLFRRLEGQRESLRLARYLGLYMIAQEIHERASSSHSPYAELAEAFFHHDVLFRMQRVLSRQGEACRTLARGLLLKRSFDLAPSEQALVDLDASLVHLRGELTDERKALLPALEAVADNLATLAQALARARHPEFGERGDRVLHDRTPQGLGEVVERLQAQLTPGSPVFRHAVRLATTLVAGFGLLHLIHPTQGYWILLTSLFVCRPSFGATRRFLWQRILGTVLGLVAGWALITLFPAPALQAGIAVVAGVAFFALRGRHYTLATAAITLMVLSCFNQVGDGFGLIWPRLVDTLLGAGIAGLAVLTILPDWQGRRLHRQAAAAVASERDYLAALVAQYAEGKRDDLTYRLARRNAHNADAELAAMLANMQQEPGPFRRDAERGVPFQLHAHTLLNYLSALGAHRGESQGVTPAESALAEAIIAELDDLALALERREPIPPGEALEVAEGESDSLLGAQLMLIARQLVPLREAAQELEERRFAPGSQKLEETP
ncbi:TIGR01666 family membrane protein [Halomonas sp. KAO]|uniref:YccS family putative transporter n=1 Tax=Halomonas sp. KAO TaxID=2783858 RepID=UPI00189E95A7|nr:YccS family putative transporter [Halomonas sp. KAO]MBF7053617.1 TIGR01666 family membrane protein [Halomonas sp. KAO]